MKNEVPLGLLLCIPFVLMALLGCNSTVQEAEYPPLPCFSILDIEKKNPKVLPEGMREFLEANEAPKNEYRRQNQNSVSGLVVHLGSKALGLKVNEDVTVLLAFVDSEAQTQFEEWERMLPEDSLVGFSGEWGKRAAVSRPGFIVQEFPPDLDGYIRFFCVSDWKRVVSKNSADQE